MSWSYPSHLHCDLLFLISLWIQLDLLTILPTCLLEAFSSSLLFAVEIGMTVGVDMMV